MSEGQQGGEPEALGGASRLLARFGEQRPRPRLAREEPGLLEAGAKAPPSALQEDIAAILHAPEHGDRRGPEHGGATAAEQPGETLEPAAGRPGLDCDEGAGEGPHAALRERQRLRAGHQALPRQRGGAGLSAERWLPAPETRAPTSAGLRGGRGGGRVARHRPERLNVALLQGEDGARKFCASGDKDAIGAWRCES